MTGIGRHLRRAAGPPADPADATDGQLLDRFLAGRDEAAFEALVRRHGRMVLGACRRLLGNAHDAEDAFQVTFLVLARKGRALTGWASVGGWLYRAACLPAHQARTQAVRRQAREARAARPEAVEPLPAADEPSALDAAVALLPARFRDVVALCELGGRTRKEAAAQLGIPEGTVSSRLATAHRRLGDRLRQRGLAAPAAGLLVAAADRLPAAVPPGLAAAATQAATVAAGFAPGSLSPTVHVLLGEVTRAMNASRLIVWCGVIATAVAAGGLAWAGRDGDPPRPPAEKPVARAPSPPVPPKDQPDPPGTGGPPRAGEPAWKAEFRKTDGRADGQALKVVPGGPFPECRADSLGDKHSAAPKGRHEGLLLVMKVDGRGLVRQTLIDGGYGWRKEQGGPQGLIVRLHGRRLWETLTDTLRLVPPLLEADDDLMLTELYADVVYRDKAPLEQVAKSLQAELTDTLGIPVTATARTEEREVLVARGKYVHRPRPGKLNGQVSVADRDLDPDDWQGTGAVMANDPAGMFRSLGEHVGRPVFDETDLASWKLVVPEGKGGDIGSWSGMWVYRYPRRSRDDLRPADASADREAVLKHLAVQTGVTFTTEKRKVEVLTLRRAK